MTKQEKANKIIEEFQDKTGTLISNQLSIDLILFVMDYDKKQNIESRKKKFIARVVSSDFRQLYSDDMLMEFYEYWTEHGENDKKMRFEKEKSFGLSRRLKTWERNSKKFNNERNSNNQSRFEGFVQANSKRQLG